MNFRLLLILLIPALIFLNSCDKKPNPPEATVMVVITEVNDTHIKLDANPPLAGKDLNFDIELVAIN